MRQSSSVSGKTVDGLGAAPRPRRAAFAVVTVAVTAEVLGGPVPPFTDLGLSSGQPTRPIAVLKDAPGVQVSLGDRFEHPDIGQLVEHLAAI